MANKILLDPLDGTPKQICFAKHADLSPASTNTDLRVTTDGSFELDVEITLTSVAAAGSRQSAKVDLGAKWATVYHVRSVFEFAATPGAGLPVDLYWAASDSATAAKGNPGNCTGTDAAYTGYSSNADAALKQLIWIGQFVSTTQATTTVQVGEVGFFSPPTRYGSLVVRNGNTAAFVNDAVEMHIVFDPITPELQ